MSKKTKKRNHYVYRIDDPVTGEFYLGSRTCKCNITDDGYMGSYKSWKPEDKSRLIKTILKSNFRKRETAIVYEAKLIKENIKNELNRNNHIPTVGFCGVGKKHPLYGKHHSDETKRKMSLKHKNKTLSESHKKQIGISGTGRYIGPMSEENKRKIGDANRGIPQKKLTCPHCGKVGGTCMNRWHFDNCKDFK